MLLKFFFLGLLLQFSNSQELFEVRLPCEFVEFAIYDFTNYACVVRDFNFNFSNPFYYIVVEGTHEGNRSNADVRNIVFTNSSINQIPSNVFQVFRNIIAVQAIESGVTEILAANFVFTSAIEGIFITNNNLPRLRGSPFQTRPSLTHLNLYSNGIESIDDTFFAGIVNLRYLSLGGNSLTSITPELMAPLVGLRTLLASFNSLESLSPRTFRTNRQIEMIAFEFNNISALGSGIFDNLPSLEFIGLLGNECVNEEFELGETRTVEDINEELSPCFANAIPEPPRRRQLVFELRGNMTLNNDDGAVIANVIGRSWF
jgi:Leucine rich repeat